MFIIEKVNKLLWGQDKGRTKWAMGSTPQNRPVGSHTDVTRELEHYKMNKSTHATLSLCLCLRMHRG